MRNAQSQDPAVEFFGLLLDDKKSSNRQENRIFRTIILNKAFRCVLL